MLDDSTVVRAFFLVIYADFIAFPEILVYNVTKNIYIYIFFKRKSQHISTTTLLCFSNLSKPLFLHLQIGIVLESTL